MQTQGSVLRWINFRYSPCSIGPWSSKYGPQNNHSNCLEMKTHWAQSQTYCITMYVLTRSPGRLKQCFSQFREVMLYITRGAAKTQLSCVCPHTPQCSGFRVGPRICISSKLSSDAAMMGLWNTLCCTSLRKVTNTNK